MKPCLQTFDTGIGNLLVYLGSTENESLLTGLLLQRRDALTEKEQLHLSNIQAANVGRKQYIYSVAIISLYGLLERFVESLIESFVRRVASLVGSYDKLPQAIVKRHTSLSLDLIKAIADDRHRSGLSQADVIENLHLCLSGASTFRVNGAAFVLHRGNVYLDKITEFLTAVGIDTHLRRVSVTREMGTCFQDIYPGRNIREVADQDIGALFEPVDSLVDRRNEISHGVINVEDIESVGLLQNRCRFLAAYAHGLYEVVIQEVLRYLVPTSAGRSLGKPIKVFNDSIVCFNITNAKVAVGNFMVAATGDTVEPFRYSRIESLEVDHVGHKEIIAAAESVSFGAKVSFKASEQYQYFAFDDDTI